MKKLFFILMMTLTVVGTTSCSAKTPKGRQTGSMFEPSPAVCKSLGKSLTEILFSPNKVKVYSLKGVENVEKNDIEIDDHFVRDTLITTLDAKQIALLQYLLLANEENYKNDSVQIRSPYIPSLEFEFVKKKEQTAHVLISLQDRTWTIIYDGKVQCNWNYTNKELIKRFSNYFVEINNKIKTEEKK
ncbi:MAG: hypothetical protein K2M96_09180 [Prevotella sp.]|nr:hypothetical protein [Prevotella sp.]